MTALADVTRPGPFTDRAQEIGRFWGIRDGGALIAMAGERMAADGYREVSGVCTAEAARGQGLARILSCHVAALIQSEGDVPFLHAYASNAAARALYERIGFVVRAEVSFGIFQRDG
jgi:predicted GNAT family acetyltransferase